MRRRRRGRITVVLVAAVVLAGCADDGGDGAAPADADPADAELVGDPARGEELVRSQGCNACHDADGRDMAGPTWQDLAGSEVELSDGTTVVADVDYLRRSIREPDAEIVAGFSASMPEIDLTDEQVDDLVAYIQTL